MTGVNQISLRVPRFLEWKADEVSREDYFFAGFGLGA